MHPLVENAALRESLDALRELAQVFNNVGISRQQIAMMLRSVADEYESPIQ